MKFDRGDLISPSRIIVYALSAICLIFGARAVIMAYHQRNIIQHCLLGGPCPYNLSVFQLQNMAENARLEMYLSGALVALSFLLLLYTIFSARSITKIDKIEISPKAR